MIVSIHQPNFFPYYGYFDKIKTSDVFVYLDNVTYSKESFTNRNRIRTLKGERWLTVPLNKKGILSKEIKDVEISNATDWRTEHKNIIYENYRYRDFYNPYEKIITSIYSKEWNNLCDFNIYTTEKMSKVLGIGNEFVRSSELGVHGRKESLILDICKTLGANTYYCGTSGKTYNDELSFKENKIEIVYQSLTHPIYRQPYGEFIPNLSILDIFFNMRIGDYI